MSVSVVLYQEEGESGGAGGA